MRNDRMRWPSTIAAGFVLAVSLPAQYLNRALWLGRDDEGIRRDYDQVKSYFLDRASYVEMPPWWTGPSLDPFGNRLYAAGGSVSTSRLTVEANGAYGIDIGSGFTARLDYLQSEHQTTQFGRIGIGIDKDLSESTAVFFQVEGGPDKSRSDISFGVEFLRSECSAHRFMLTFVDFPWRKSDVFEYDQVPYGLMLAGFFGDPEAVEVAYEIGSQLPFKERRIEDDETFGMYRTIFGIDTRVRLGERDRLVLGCDGELTGKELHPADPAAPEREDGDVDLWRIRAEWWRSFDHGVELALGGSYLHLAEDGVRPNAPADDLRVRRDEALLTGRARFGLGGAWAMEPYVMGGYTDFEQRIGSDVDGYAGFLGKAGAPVLFAFSERARMRVDLSFSLDELSFGGGGVQFLATF